MESDTPPPRSGDDASLTTSYRRVVQDLQSLKQQFNVLIRLLQQEIEASSDPGCAGRLEGPLQRAQDFLKESKVSSPRRNTDDMPPIPISPRKREEKFPVLPVPRTSPRQLERSSGSARTSPRSPRSSPTLVAAEHARRKSLTPFDGLYTLPPLVAHFVVMSLPTASQIDLACTSKRWHMTVKMVRKNITRTNLLLEILQTERSYIRMLKEAHTVYRPALLRLGVLNQAQSDTLFSYLPTLILVNTKLEREVSKRISNWSDDSCIGDVFVSMAPELRVYKTYGQGYHSTNDVIADLFSKTNCRNTLDSIQREKHVGRLDALLVCPIQRLPRYVLLLRQLLRHTNSSHPDYKLINQGISAVENVLDLVEAGVRDVSHQQDLFKVLQEINGIPDAVRVNRVMSVVKSGEVSWMHGARLYPCRWILFKDFMLMAIKDGVEKDHWRFLLSISIINSMMRIVQDDGKMEGSSTFFLEVSSTFLQTVRLVFSVESEQVQHEWIQLWKKQTTERRQTQLDETVQAMSSKIAKMLPSKPKGPEKPPIKSGWCDKKKLVGLMPAFKKRYLVLTHDALLYYVKPGGEQKGAIELRDISAVHVSGEELDLHAGGCQYAIKTEDDVSSWLDSIQAAMAAKRVKTSSHASNAIQICFSDGTRAFVVLQESDNAKMVLDRVCAKRHLDANKHELISEQTGFSLSSFAGISDMQGKTFRLERKEGQAAGIESVNLVDLIGEDGSKSRMFYSPGESLHMLLERYCSKRSLNSLAFVLFQEGAPGPLKMSDVVSSYRGKTLVVKPDPRANLVKQRSDVGMGARKKGSGTFNTVSRMELSASKMDLSVSLNEIDSSHLTKSAGTRAMTEPDVLVKVELPDMSSYNKVLIQRRCKAADVVANICKKRALAPSEYMLFNIQRNSLVANDTPVIQLASMNLRLVSTNHVAAEESAEYLVQDIFSTQLVEDAVLLDYTDSGSGDFYVGSVTTGEKGMSPMKRTQTKLPSVAPKPLPRLPPLPPISLTQSSPDVLSPTGGHNQAVVENLNLSPRRAVVVKGVRAVPGARAATVDTASASAAPVPAVRPTHSRTAGQADVVKKNP